MKTSGFGSYFSIIGPGIAIAATGIGAGDLVAASVSGAKFGTVILWAAVFGAIIKYAVNDGIARWQLATDTTLIEGWAKRLSPVVIAVFGVYLFLWSFIVAGALISACGLAGNTLFGGLSVKGWGVVHSLIAALLVATGKYQLFERLMKWLIAPMFILIVLCALLVKPDWVQLFPNLVVPIIPAGSGLFILGIIGGVGGSVTLLSYGYWIREKQWTGIKAYSNVKVDLSVAYVMTGLFGIAIMIIASGINVEVMKGTGMILAVADQLSTVLGPTGKWFFLIGFWCAVFTSMLGVWQGIPYLFTDFIRTIKRNKNRLTNNTLLTDSILYRSYLGYLAIPPMILLLVERPVWIIILYSIIGSLFMPFLAGTLLVMNNRSRWVGSLKNGWVINILLIVSVAIFGYLGIREIISVVTR